MTLDKFGRHISQPKQSTEDHGANVASGLYYNVILTFQSTTFQENTKNYLISNIKTCHNFFYESALIEFVFGYPPDVIVIINEKEFTLNELVNVQLRRGDSISFREKDPQTENSSLFLEFFIRVPVGINI